MSDSRRSGALCHISSLPGAYGVGDFGSASRAFADFLAKAGFSVWQILPLSPVDAAFGYSPYSSPSSFAGNILFVSAEELCREGLLTDAEAREFGVPRKKRADYEAALKSRQGALAVASRRFNDAPEAFCGLRADFEKFKAEESYWLRDYALFTALKNKNNERAWNEWDEKFAFRDAAALRSFEEENNREIAFTEFSQFLFYRHLGRLADYCGTRGISLMGDLPMYVAWDSADVWANREFFDLNDDGSPRCVAGVPPDYFSEDGQRWGNPLYKWEVMRRDGFAWWRTRLSHALKYCGYLRIDHFRGLCGFWEIPAKEPTARNGAWRPALGAEMLRAFFAAKEDGGKNLVAEDLGVITDDVRELMKETSLPGIKVLMFAFDGNVSDNPYAPHNLERRSFVYTGTHDNDTAVGWWLGSSTQKERKNFAAYVGREITEANVASVMTRAALSSVSDVAVIPLQDLLSLGGDARMNEPSVARGNWLWRLEPEQLDALLEENGVAARLKAMNVIYGRAK